MFDLICNAQKEYTQINITDCINWQLKNKKADKLDINLINEYLKEKKFLGCVIKKKFRYIILNSENEPIKMFLDLTSMFNYLQFMANSIEIDFKGYKAKALKMY